ncbi:MAG: N-acetylmuramoyl-L-alanine amidase [Akkermansiaceae bacterium]|jgi:N-acetylmuramoyl-L-alanine amidase|nr:N-acetylmuramoyl-L-alanine amidase [Akkermansiaceae bacterium]MDP4647894.1 N-acetylmuramoyl-L-alanine amidase [Akkermansiaceae bacterium]MDP4719684.1 N-acetylmuramoyl-L-alanine amidase [Akkermansiaceae bacterium]MDP4779760.1 N-acetylmuramoyl-L-alanine amidase [Akkermansiaceae bacterium]MDP4845995.1 N-acetylmuramoyl-L-alanine amidase [Akkermansiaceae bacterium]
MRNPALITVSILGAIVLFVAIGMRKSADKPTTEDLSAPTPEEFNTPPPSSPTLSILAENPDWSSLEAYQHTITRSDFEKLLTNIFTTDDTWREFITLSDTSAAIRTSSEPTDPVFILRFATPEKNLPAPRTWKSTADLPIPPSGKPLTNLHIAIDPGHIGGEWAKIEERWFKIGTGTPVAEGDMTLRVAKLLKPLLEELGATVTLVRTTNDPVTPLRPRDLSSLAADTTGEDPASLRKFTEKLFYRTAEIRARADLVNDTIKPDLVLCLHFNAAGWGNPAKPTLVPSTHFHILVNGAYTEDEVRLADQRFALLEKLLQRTHEEEILVGKTVANVFAEISKLPAYRYNTVGQNVRTIPGSKFLYARNLLANRLYDCPVIFMEPYVMNSTHDYNRIQAGDYDGLKKINGQLVPSIFQEYANALATALTTHYSKSHR